MANFKGDNVNNKFWKTKCGNGQAWYGACGRGDYCGSSYGKNVGAIETYFDGMTTMICFFKVPTLPIHILIKIHSFYHLTSLRKVSSARK